MDIFTNMKSEQQKLYDQRVALIGQLNDTHPKAMTKDLINNISDQLT